MDMENLHLFLLSLSKEVSIQNNNLLAAHTQREAVFCCKHNTIINRLTQSVLFLSHLQVRILARLQFLILHLQSSNFMISICTFHVVFTLCICLFYNQLPIKLGTNNLQLACTHEMIF